MRELILKIQFCSCAKLNFLQTFLLLTLLLVFHIITKQVHKLLNLKKHIFVNGYPNRQLIKADGSEHQIIYENPSLVINAIIKAFVATVDEKQKSEILNKSLENAIEIANRTKNAERTYFNSVNYLNELGYSYMENNELKEALEIFKLNTSLFPNDWNVYDSYGEALLNAKNNVEAIKMYKKSLALNPNNKNAIDILNSLKNTK
jgi:tetratricopeptide (TPR) repeat protein